jgi:hypothetical protein
MISLAFLLASSCYSHALTLAEAKARVLAAPNIRAAVARRQAHPFFESIVARPGGWTFTVNARNACAGPGPCSTLLGHYAVDRKTGVLWDMDAGEGGKPVKTPHLLRRSRNC